jgi:hypothetical protein
MVRESRPFDPLDFLRIADALATDDADEASLRTAIGKVYYALFLIARDKTGIEGRATVHECVRAAISPHDHRLASRLGTIGHIRLVADYEVTTRSPQDRDWHRNWEIARRNARFVLRDLAALPDITPSNPGNQ